MFLFISQGGFVLAQRHMGPYYAVDVKLIRGIQGFAALVGPAGGATHA